MSSLTSTGHRDNQKQRLYDAEHVVKGVIASKAGRKYLIDEARLIPQNGWYLGPVVRKDKNGKDKGYAASIEDCQRYVDHVVRTPWFQRRWGQRTYTVVWKASGNATCTGGRTIALPPWARTEGVILHEMAHGLRRQGAWHGEDFAAIFLFLVRHAIGAEHARVLRVAYRQNRVRTRAAAVPKPTMPVVSATARRERAATRQAGQDIRLNTRVWRSTNAKVLRALVSRADEPFGAPGSKSRRYALDTARTLWPERSTAWRGLIPPEDVRRAAAGVRAAVRAGDYGATGSKPRARALAVARTLDAMAESLRPAPMRKMTYAATPQKW